jgi:hypothetical protein
METFVRTLLVLLAVTFASGVAAHSANVTTMSVDMAISASHAPGTETCMDCPDGDGLASTCDFTCTPIQGVMSSDYREASLTKAAVFASAVDILGGRARPPASHPPRTTILS